MTITVIGTGYVGLVLAVGLADFGHQVTGIDTDAAKIKRLAAGDPVIYEPGLAEYLSRNLAAGRLSFTLAGNEDTGDNNIASGDAAAAIGASDVVFLAVGTPPKDDGNADLRYIEAAADFAAANIRGYTVIVTKSTVPVGTNRAIWARVAKADPSADFDVVSNPEFLREGRAVQDFFHPDRVVLGVASPRARETMEGVYRALNLISVPFVVCGLETAELIKYASNAFLAVKIGFINEMANLADAAGADIHAIARAMGMDGRISPKFLHPGPGFGGSCFPKDCRALAAAGDRFGAEQSIVRATLASNERQKLKPVEKLKKHLPVLKDKRVAVLGLAFKQESARVEGSPALVIIRGLLDGGAEVRAHDPKAMDACRLVLPDITYCASSADALCGADAVITAAEWNEYRGLDLAKAAELMRGRVIIDGRNLFEPEEARAAGFTYEGMGRGV